MRVGIIALLQESNTFIQGSTTLRHFEEDLLLTGPAIRDRLADSNHEIGGFFAGLDAARIEAVPIFVARAYPFGVIEAAAFDYLVDQMTAALADSGHLDGILAAPHGATVAENHPDADGYWLSRVREFLGPDKPLIGTIDPHANLSTAMVQATDALIAYRTNPHVDQREAGMKASALMARVLQKRSRLTQAATFPPLAINIQCQQTEKPPLRTLYDYARRRSEKPDVLSVSVVLGFPYADVAEMGSSVIIVTENQPSLAQTIADDVAGHMWGMRDDFDPPFLSIEEALNQVQSSGQRTLLLDMGDNVGGGSPADGTLLLHGMAERSIAPAFVCLHDPAAVAKAAARGVGGRVTLGMGGNSDVLHGRPFEAECGIVGLYDGHFRESSVRHGGFTEFDQGRTAVVRTQGGITIMLTSRRIPPFSLEQLHSCSLDPKSFRVIVAKGVVAPLAAYGPVVDQVIHVNTPGVTCADMTRLPFANRRRPMFPFERDTAWSDS